MNPRDVPAVKIELVKFSLFKKLNIRVQSLNKNFTFNLKIVCFKFKTSAHQERR